MKSGQEESESQLSEAQSQKKKTYDIPCLITYGSIREITQAVGTAGQDDGVTKTSLA